MRTGVVVAAALAIAGPVLATAVPIRGDDAGTVARIVAYDKAINGIETAGGSAAARGEKFVAIVKTYYDMPAIAALVAGPAWATAAAADRTAASDALARHSALALAKNFTGPHATRFIVDPAPITRAGNRIVKVTIDGTTLYYRMRGTKIIDVISGGVSQLALQRADIATTVASGGVAAMAAKLRQLDGGR